MDDSLRELLKHKYDDHRKAAGVLPEHIKRNFCKNFSLNKQELAQCRIVRFFKKRRYTDCINPTSVGFDCMFLILHNANIYDGTTTELNIVPDVKIRFKINEIMMLMFEGIILDGIEYCLTAGQKQRVVRESEKINNQMYIQNFNYEKSLFLDRYKLQRQ